MRANNMRSNTQESEYPKGIDVTDAQLAQAQDFLRSAAGGKYIIRLLAWYGAIRAKSGRETPAPRQMPEVKR